jgi:hypothetical protein
LNSKVIINGMTSHNIMGYEGYSQVVRFRSGDIPRSLRLLGVMSPFARSIKFVLPLVTSNNPSIFTFNSTAIHMLTEKRQVV